MESRRIGSTEELLNLLDQITAAGERGDRTQGDIGEYWTMRLQDPRHPLAHNRPDEPLATWASNRLLGDLDGLQVLDIGSGNGRNSVWLASQGAHVTALDIAGDLLRSYPRLQRLTTIQADVIRDDIPPGPFDFVYDSGCFHHIPPHRRATYIERVTPLVRQTSGLFGIAAFSSDALDIRGDEEALLAPGTFNGYTFSAPQLQRFFGHWSPLELRPFTGNVANTFGPDYLIAALFRAD